MKNLELEQLLNSELESVKGGISHPVDDTCICENGGAAATIIVVEPEPETPGDPIINV